MIVTQTRTHKGKGKRVQILKWNGGRRMKVIVLAKVFGRGLLLMIQNPKVQVQVWSQTWIAQNM